MSHPPIASLVPHSGPSVLLDRVVERRDDGILCRVEIRPGMLFVDHAGLPSIVSIELMAQAIAAYAGYLRRDSGDRIENAFLLSCRDLTLATPRFEVGDVLDVEATVAWNGGASIGSVPCHIFRGGEELAAGVLNVYQGSLADDDTEQRL